MEIIQASQENAEDLARLINLAGEGLPKYLWGKMAEDGQDAMTVGKLRAARSEGGFSYKNARVYAEGSTVMAMIISYKQPDPYSLEDIEDCSDIVKPLILLEAQAPGSWYINALATFEQYRGRGLARKLLSEAEERAVAQKVSKMSLIVASENTGAKGLYEYLGYQALSSLPVVAYPGCLHGGEWILMSKTL